MNDPDMIPMDETEAVEALRHALGNYQDALANLARTRAYYARMHTAARAVVGDDVLAAKGFPVPRLVDDTEAGP